MKLKNMLATTLTPLLTAGLIATSLLLTTASFATTVPANQPSVVWIPGHWYSGYWIPGQYVSCEAPVIGPKVPKPNVRYRWDGSAAWRR